MGEGKRSRTQGMQSSGQGVGARQEGAPPPVRGGGYLDICIDSEPPVGGHKNRAASLALDELRQIGIPAHWLAVAEVIGVEAMIAAWRVLDESGPVDERGRVPVPRFSTYLRYQRNRWIRTLSADGHDKRTIQTMVRRQLGETISLRHIDRVLGAG